MRAAKRFALLFLVLAALGSGVYWRIAGSGPSEERERKSEPGKLPNDWFYFQRSYPELTIPGGAHGRALAQAVALRDAQTQAIGAAGKAAVLPPAWALAGPTNIGGRITAIGSHPSVPSTVFVGAAAGGVWKSTDSGATWAQVFDGVGSQSIGAIAVAPSDPATIYVGTGEANGSGDSYDGDGVWISRDGGVLWSPLGLAATRRIGRIALDPTDSTRVYVAAAGPLFSKDTNRGIYRSTDAGRTWQQTLFVSDSTSAIDVVVEPGTPANVYAAMWERIRRPYQRQVGGFTSGIYKSTDYGATWTLLAGGLPAPGPTVGRIGLSASVSAPGRLVAVYCDHPGNFMGLYRTTDSGASWARMSDASLSSIYSGFGWYFGQVRIDPTNDSRIFVLGVPLYRTTNLGASWSSVGSGVHVDHHDLWINPTLGTQIYEGNDGGFYRSTNGGSPWTKSLNLPITQFYATTMDFNAPSTSRYGGTQDNSTMRTLTGSTNDWQVILGGDGFYCLVDPSNPNVIYAEYQYGGFNKSTDGGSSFFDALNGVSGSDRFNWSMPVVMDPQSSQTLCLGTNRVYRTTNAAGVWTAISPDLTEGPSPANLVYGTITTLAIAPSSSSVIYVGTDDGNVWVTQDTGGNWANISAGLPDRWVTRVAIDPVDHAVAYVTLSGYRNDEYQPHVFRTTDHGTSWTDISGNLPEAPVNVIVVDPIVDGSNPSPLYVGTDFGVYASYDLGAGWGPLGVGHPLCVVSDLTFDPTSRTLLSGTHGRSMYATTLLSSATGVTPTAGSPVVAAATLGAATPNPSRGDVRVALALARPADVAVAVYDASGRRVRALGRRGLAAGAHALVWDRRDDEGARVPAGAYFLRVEAAGVAATRKMVVID